MDRRRWLLSGAAALAAVLVAARVAAPHLAKDRINSAMESMGPYRGHVEDVDLAAWRASYTLHGVHIAKRGGPDVPFVENARVQVDVGWGALLGSEGSARVVVSGAEVTFMDAMDASRAQAGEEVPWQRDLNRLAPVPVDVLVLQGTRFHLRNQDTSPPVDLVVAAIEGRARGLAGPGQARIELRGTAEDGSAVRLHARIDAGRRPQQASFELHVEGLSLTAVNDLLRAYAGIDVHSGTATASVEARFADGRIQGHGQLRVSNVDVLSWQGDVEGGDDLRQLLREAAAGIVTALKTDSGGGSDYRQDFSLAWQPDRDDSLEALLEIGRIAVAGAAGPLVGRDSALASLP